MHSPFLLIAVYFLCELTKLCALTYCEHLLYSQVNSGGAGPVSAEWMVPKALWLFQEEPETYQVTVLLAPASQYIICH
jgi:ribulose kinase